MPRDRSPSQPDPYANHRMRVITVSGSGQVIADSLQPWSHVTVTSIVSGNDPGFPAAEVPSGVIHRSADGREILKTVDGLRLELDGSGAAAVYDGEERVDGLGVFMVVEVVAG